MCLLIGEGRDYYDCYQFEIRIFVSVHPVCRMVGSLYHLTRDFVS